MSAARSASPWIWRSRSARPDTTRGSSRCTAAARWAGPRGRRAGDRGATCFVASSGAVAAYLRAGGHDDPPVVPCGIDLGRFRFKEPARTVAPRLLTVGRLDTQKNQAVLIDALALILPRWP